MKTHVTQVVVVSRSRWMVGSAGTTRVCWSTYETHATASRPRVTAGPRAAAGWRRADHSLHNTSDVPPRPRRSRRARRRRRRPPRPRRAAHPRPPGAPRRRGHGGRAPHHAPAPHAARARRRAQLGERGRRAHRRRREHGHADAAVARAGRLGAQGADRRPGRSPPPTGRAHARRAPRDGSGRRRRARPHPRAAGAPRRVREGRDRRRHGGARARPRRGRRASGRRVASPAGGLLEGRVEFGHRGRAAATAARRPRGACRRG